MLGCHLKLENISQGSVRYFKYNEKEVNLYLCLACGVAVGSPTWMDKHHKSHPECAKQQKAVAAELLPECIKLRQDMRDTKAAAALVSGGGGGGGAAAEEDTTPEEVRKLRAELLLARAEIEASAQLIAAAEAAKAEAAKAQKKIASLEAQLKKSKGFQDYNSDKEQAFFDKWKAFAGEEAVAPYEEFYNALGVPLAKHHLRYDKEDYLTEEEMTEELEAIDAAEFLPRKEKEEPEEGPLGYIVQNRHDCDCGGLHRLLGEARVPY